MREQTPLRRKVKALKEARLQLTTADDRNSAIHMLQTRSDRFEVRQNAVGATSFGKPYPIALWDRIYHKYIAEGYVDVTEVHLTETSANKKSSLNDDPLEGEQESVRCLWTALTRFARKAFKPKSDWQGNTADVTTKMVEEGRKILDQLATVPTADENVEVFNELLIKLFNVCPFQMEHVKDYLAESPDDFEGIEAFQINRLNQMEAQLKIQEAQKSCNDNSKDSTPRKSLFETLGISIREATSCELKQLLSHLDPLTRKRTTGNAWIVDNFKTHARFSQYMQEHTGAKKHFLYHGSGNENMQSIIINGLLPRSRVKGVRTVGKMFGLGVAYLAPLAFKAAGYTSCTWKHAPGVGSGRDMKDNKSYLLVFRAAYDDRNCLHVQQWKPWMSQLDRESMAKKGYDTLFAHKGVSLQNDEIVVFDEAQVTIYAIIELNS